MWRTFWHQCISDMISQFFLYKIIDNVVEFYTPLHEKYTNLTWTMYTIYDDLHRSILITEKIKSQISGDFLIYIPSLFS